MEKGSSRPEYLFLKPNPKPQFGFGGTCGGSERGVVMSIHFPNFFSLHPVYKYPHCSDPSTFCHIKTPSNRQILNHKIEIINKMSSADDQYEQQNDITSDDAPAGDSQDNDYVSRPGQKGGPIPVQSDNAAVEDSIDGATADSDQQLGIFPLSSSQECEKFSANITHRER
jgi:hypothetical protein